MNTNLKNSLLQTYISEADELNGNFSLPTIHQKWPQQYEFDITYMKKKISIVIFHGSGKLILRYKVQCTKNLK